MICTCCVSLARCEHVYDHFNDFLGSKEVKEMASSVIGTETTTILKSSLLSLLENHKSYGKVSRFVVLFVADGKEILEYQQILEIFTIFRLISIDSDFIYHYMFKKFHKNNLIKIESTEKIIIRLELDYFSAMNAVSAFSFTHESYLSNVEFVSFIKTCIKSSFSDDFCPLGEKIFSLLDEDKNGQITEEQVFTLINEKYFSLTKKTISDLIWAFHSNDERILCSKEFPHFYSYAARVCRIGIKFNEIFDIIYCKFDPMFSGHVSGENASIILKKAFEAIEKEISHIPSLEESSYTYNKLLEIVNELNQ